MSLLTLLHSFFAPPPQPVAVDNATVTLWQRPGSGFQTDGLMSTGQTFRVINRDSFVFGGGQSAWFPAVMSDGKVIIPGQPFTATSFEPTSNHMEYEVFDPFTQILSSYNIPTSTGIITTVSPSFTYQGGADIEDSQQIFLASGEEICVMVAGRPYNNWRVSTTGYYPAITVLKKAAGSWVYDPVRSKTSLDMFNSNPTDAATNSSWPTGTNTFSETFYSARNMAEMTAPFPHSNCFAVTKYDDKTGSGQQSGVLTIIDPETMAVQVSFLLPNCSDSEGSPLGSHCREVQSDPSSSLDDERFILLCDQFYIGPATTPIYHNDFEAGTTGWGAVFGSMTFAQSTTLAHSATHSMKITSSSGSQGTVFGPSTTITPVIPGNKYNFTAFFQPDAGNSQTYNCSIGVHWLDSSNTQRGSATSFSASCPAGVWTQITGTLQCPSNATRAVPVINQFSTATAQSTYVDDIDILPNNTGSSAPFCIQEWAYNNSAKTLIPKSAPVLPADTSLRYETMCFDRFGTLYLGQSVTASYYGTEGDTAVYMKRQNGERQFVTDNPADGTWTIGGTTSQWGIHHQADYSVASQIATLIPVGMFFDDVRELLVIPSKAGQLQFIRVTRFDNQLAFSVPIPALDISLNTLVNRTISQISATKPTYDKKRAVMHWPVRGTSSAWTTTDPIVIRDQFMYSVNIAALLEKDYTPPGRFVISKNDSARKFVVDGSKSRKLVIS